MACLGAMHSRASTSPQRRDRRRSCATVLPSSIAVKPPSIERYTVCLCSTADVPSSSSVRKAAVRTSAAWVEPADPAAPVRSTSGSAVFVRGRISCAVALRERGLSCASVPSVPKFALFRACFHDAGSCSLSRVESSPQSFART